MDDYHRRTRVKVKGVEEFTHVVWADKVEQLAAAIPDTNGLLIGAIQKAMPKVLQKVTRTGHTEWVSFCKAIWQHSDQRSKGG
jgi:hypothetical protein